MLAAVRRLSRLELVGESLRAALEQLAQAAPDWLLPLAEPEWDKRYGRKAEIGTVPDGKAGVTALTEAFGRDGCKVLAATFAPDTQPALGELPQGQRVHGTFDPVQLRFTVRAGRFLPLPCPSSPPRAQRPRESQRCRHALV